MSGSRQNAPRTPRSKLSRREKAAVNGATNRELLKCYSILATGSIPGTSCLCLPESRHSSPPPVAPGRERSSFILKGLNEDSGIDTGTGSVTTLSESKWKWGSEHYHRALFHADEAFQRAIESDRYQDQARAQLYRGHCFRGLGEWKLAHQCYVRAACVRGPGWSATDIEGLTRQCQDMLEESRRVPACEPPTSSSLHARMTDGISSMSTGLSGSTRPGEWRKDPPGPLLGHDYSGESIRNGNGEKAAKSRSRRVESSQTGASFSKRDALRNSVGCLHPIPPLRKKQGSPNLKEHGRKGGMSWSSTED